MIRAAIYLGIAVALLSSVFPNPFPVLMVGAVVALGAAGTELHQREEGGR